MRRWCAALVLALLADCSWVPSRKIEGCYAPSGVAFEAEAPTSGLTRLVAIGDFGTAAGGRNAQVARALRLFVEASGGVERVVELGDNFYGDAFAKFASPCEPDRVPPEVTTDLVTVLEPFEFLRDRGVPVLAIAGNHDHVSATALANEAQLDRCLPPAHRWAEQWEFVWGEPREVVLGGGAVQLVLLDSDAMIGDSGFRAASAATLERLLAAGAGRYRWRLLAGHHPLRTYGTHHNAGWRAQALQAASLLFFPSHLLAALNIPGFHGLNQKSYALRYRAYRNAVEKAIDRSGVPVHLFLAGHDHQLQLLAPEKNDQPYIAVSGSAAKCDDVYFGARTLFAAPKNGFVAITVLDDRLRLDFIGTTSCRERTACAGATEPSPHLLYRQDIF
jgi:hypothetical protein